MTAATASKTQPGSRPSTIPWLLGFCAALIAGSTIVVGGWLAIKGAGSLLSVLASFDPSGVVRPLLATVYVSVLALPPAALVGALAAAALADERIFAASVPTIRRSIVLLGTIPTIVTATAILIIAGAIGWHPTLTGASFAVAIASMPLMTALASRVIGTSASAVGEAAIALGATPSFLVTRVLLPRVGLRFGTAFVLGATNIIGGAAVVAMIAGAGVSNAAGSAPVGAWPLAVQLWMRAPVADSYGATAAGALVLTLLLWLLQGVARLRATPPSAAETR